MVEGRGEAYDPKEEPTVPEFLLSSLYNAMFYSAVVLLLKNSHRREGELWEERVGVFIRPHVFILLYNLVVLQEKIQSLTFTVAAVF